MTDYFILLVGESGSGKTSVAFELAEKYQYRILQSYTTRAPRTPGEWGHIFVNDEQFDELTDFVGFTVFNGHRYCATSQQVDDNDIYVIDPAGVDFFAEAYKGNKEPIVFFLNVSKRERKRRMLERGDSLPAVRERLKHDGNAFKKFRKQSLLSTYPTTIWLDAEDVSIERVAQNINDVIEFFRESEGDLT